MDIKDCCEDVYHRTKDVPDRADIGKCLSLHVLHTLVKPIAKVDKDAWKGSARDRQPGAILIVEHAPAGHCNDEWFIKIVDKDCIIAELLRIKNY